ncbi:hypothetical protein NBRC10512_007644 [Rhodotorula toruloides]|uniref:N-alpha-acetyltransferase 60 n=2 Tax=Rhodotorula toruloides TaxID=5286 RepID=A0A061AT04_RHOTO|nr:GCN5-related N-acetyltransferase (GNAT) family protein [Rhodotorula toruloides NP11]EMS20765.1 GCN5-related N-acetyltransferase (GNAT) family protein [Rhodotorula toruloides NP11]CDR40307.1 RHTO0S05e01156g1_1 [Rhodotorula toruloides]
MLDLRPAFLPLQPLSQAQMKLGSSPVSPGGPISPLSLDNDTISDIRHSLRPFPLLALQQRKLEFVSLGNKEDGDDEPQERLARELVVRPMKRADVERVRELQDASLPVSYPPSFYTVLLTNPSSLSLVAYHPSDPSTLLGTIAGQLIYPAPSLSSAPQTPTIYILSLSVSPSFRRHGLASHLLRSMTRSLLPPPLFNAQKQEARLSLHVEARNDGARKMYERNGLRIVARQRGFYSRLRGGGNGEAVEMEGVVRV